MEVIEEKLLTMYEKAEKSVQYCQTRTDIKPTIGFILGSGLGEFADQLENKVYISFKDIPYFKKSTVVGHAGNLVFGQLHGKNIVAMQGRFHYYEGHHINEVTFPVRVMKLYGVETLIVTNAAGGVNTMLYPGDLMIIKDHINLMGTNPLIGKNEDKFGPRFPDMSDIYCKEIRDLIKTSMKNLNISIKEGVYTAFTGPSYETPAEIRMVSLMGGDAVGILHY